MSQTYSEGIVSALATEIGPDASYYRTKSERLYLSGIEIATLMGTGILISFCLGLFEGIKKGVSKHAEQLGEALIDTLIKKLENLIEGVKEIDDENSDEILPKLHAVNTALDELLPIEKVRGILIEETEDLYAIEIEKVSQYLIDIGFPASEVAERAEVSVVIIKREWDSLC